MSANDNAAGLLLSPPQLPRALGNGGFLFDSYSGLRYNVGMDEKRAREIFPLLVFQPEGVLLGGSSGFSIHRNEAGKMIFDSDTAAELQIEELEAIIWLMKNRDTNRGVG